MSLLRWLLLGLALNAPLHAQTAQFQSGPIQVGDVRAAPTPPAAMVGAVYLWIRNQGTAADTLLGAETPVAERVEIHRSSMNHGVMQMRQVTTLECPPGVTQVEPGALHFMLLGLKKPLVADTRFPLSLRFQGAGVLVVQVSVKAPN